MRWFVVTVAALAALFALLHLRLPVGVTLIGVALISGASCLATVWHRGSDQHSLTVVLTACLVAMMAFLTLWIPGAWTFAQS